MVENMKEVLDRFYYILHKSTPVEITWCHHMCWGPRHRTSLRSETIGKYDYREHTNEEENGPNGDEITKK